MKKRSVKKQARETENKILENNKEWIDGFIKQNYPDENKKRKKKNVSAFAVGQPKTAVRSSRSSVAVVGTLSVVVAICLIAAIVAFALLFNPTVPVPLPKKNYLTENEKNAESDILELNSGLKDFSVKLEEGFDGKLNRIYDSISNDTLYYSLDIAKIETTEMILIHFYVNKDFLNRKTIKDIGNASTQTIGVFEILYNEEKVNEDWAYKLQYNAITEYNEVSIYIEYEQYSLDGTSNLFNFIEQTFIVT